MAVRRRDLIRDTIASTLEEQQPALDVIGPDDLWFAAVTSQRCPYSQILREQARRIIADILPEERRMHVILLWNHTADEEAALRRETDLEAAMSGQPLPSANHAADVLPDVTDDLSVCGTPVFRHVVGYPSMAMGIGSVVHTQFGFSTASFREWVTETFVKLGIELNNML